ncbi:hypothetical protein D3C87_1299740 [compost metagenome]
MVGDLPNQAPTLVRCLLQQRVERFPRWSRREEGEVVVDGKVLPFEVAEAVWHQVVLASHVLLYNHGEVLAHYGQSEIDQLRRASTREKWGMCEHGLHSLTWHPFQMAQIAEVLSD